MESVKKKLNSKFKIKDLGKGKNCLRIIRINRDYNKECITLDQEQQINQLLKQFNMTESKSVNTPRIKICFSIAKMILFVIRPYRQIYLIDSLQGA